MSSYELMKKFSSENKQILLIYFLVNILTYSLESIGLSNVMGEVFDKFGSKNSSTEDVKRLIILVVGISIAVKIGYVIKQYYYNTLIPRFNRYIREHLFECILERYKVYYQELRLGHVLSNFYDLPIALYTLVEEILSEYIPNTVAILVAVGFLMYLNLTIGLVALAGVVVIALIIYFSIRQGIVLSTQEYRTYQGNNEFIQDRLGNLFNIYASNAEAEEFKEYSNIEKKLETDWGDSYKYNSNVSTAIGAVVSIVFATVLYLLYNMYQDKNNRSSTLITIILVMTYYTSYLSSIAHNFARIVDLAGALRQCDTFLSELNKTADKPESKKPVNITEGNIMFKNVNFRYPKLANSDKNSARSSTSRGGGSTDTKDADDDKKAKADKNTDKDADADKKANADADKKANDADKKANADVDKDSDKTDEDAKDSEKDQDDEDQDNDTDTNSNYILKDANLIIKPNSIVTIFGQSGTGKTTILKLILGFYGVETGSVTVDGQDVFNVDVEDLRRHISIADQNVQLFDKSVIDNIAYGSDATRQDVLDIITKFNVGHIYAKLKNGLDTLTGPNGMNLSRGQRQVIIILRSMMKKSKILLMDEPTSALDKNTKTLILNILGKLNDRTIVIITHDKDVLDYSQINYNLANGKLTQMVKPEKKPENVGTSAQTPQGSTQQIPQGSNQRIPQGSNQRIPQESTQVPQSGMNPPGLMQGGGNHKYTETHNFDNFHHHIRRSHTDNLGFYRNYY